MREVRKEFDLGKKNSGGGGGENVRLLLFFWCGVVMCFPAARGTGCEYQDNYRRWKERGEIPRERINRRK